MNPLNGARLTAQASQCLQGKNGRQLAAFHTGITAAAALVITLLQYVLALQVEKTSGLAGLGTRSILQTVQTVLQWGNVLLLPFWTMGFTYAGLQWARGNTPNRQDLLMGFRRFGPYMRLLLSRGLIVVSVLVICANLASMLYMLTPAAGRLTEQMANMDMAQAQAYINSLDAGGQQQMLRAMLPLLLLLVFITCALLVPLLYRLRMAPYFILDRKENRAIPAMVFSAALMRRSCLHMLKLDLRFWWYYALELLCSLLCYGDILLRLLGVRLPVSDTALYLGFYLLYLVALVAVRTAFFAKVQTTYALAYETLLREAEQTPPQPQPAPGKVLWDM